MEYKKYRLNVIKIFIIIFLNSLVFAYVIERLFALERGISILEMQYIIIIYSITTLIFEVPSGVLSDKWKRKYVLAIGIGFCFFEFFISIFAYNFSMFSLAFILSAIGGSFKSGTWDSILYESLSKIDKENEYEKFRGYIKLMKYVSNGTIGILGGYIAHRYSFVTNYYLSLISTPFAILVCFTIYEPNNDNKTIIINRLKTENIIKHINDSIKVIRRNRSLIDIIFYSGIVGAILHGELHEMSSLVYPKIGIPIYLFGYIGFLITVLGGLSGVLAAKIKKYNLKFILNSILILSTISIYLFSKANQFSHVLYLIIAIFLMEIVSPLTSGYIHNSINDEYRATISSINSFVLNFLTIITSLVFGYFSNRYSVFEGFLSLSIITGLCSIEYIIKGIINKFNVIKLNN